MKAFIFFKKNLIIAFALLFFFISFLINQNLTKPHFTISKQEETWNLNDQMLLNFNMGFKRFASSLLWVSTILESDIEHYTKKDLNSWMFLRFKTISKIDPNFYENYAFAGPYLSIIKDDILGASTMYKLGLAIFPDDFVLLRDAAYHFHFEVNDYEMSYKIHRKLIAHRKIPASILSSLARIEQERGNSDAAFSLLSSKLSQMKDQESFLAKKIISHLYSIKAEKDLECLNRNPPNRALCDKLDYNKNLYFQNNGIFYAQEQWVPFRIKKKLHQ